MIKKTIFLLILNFGFCSNVFSKPNVLGDEGLNISIEEYRSIFKLNFEKAQIKDASLALKNVEHGSFPGGFEGLLPFRTKSLSPGKVLSKPYNRYKGNRPVCVIGDDDFSLKWIKKVKPILLKNNAACFVTNVENKAGIDRIIRALKPIPWQLLHADRILDKLGVKHYPVLLSKLGVEQ